MLTGPDVYKRQVMNREKGFRDRLLNTGIQILWSVTNRSGEPKENLPADQPEVNFVAALDNNSLTAAGELSLIHIS